MKAVIVIADIVLAAIRALWLDVMFVVPLIVRDIVGSLVVVVVVVIVIVITKAR